MKNPQGANSLVVNAPAEKIWSILVDHRRLCEWAPMVLKTRGEKEALDAVRYCKVEWHNKTGEIEKHCIDFTPPERICWLIEDDTLGISEMLQDLGFDFRLEPMDSSATLLVCTTLYQPKNLAASVINPVLLVWQFRKIRKEMLANIKRLAEDHIGEAVFSDELGQIQIP